MPRDLYVFNFGEGQEFFDKDRTTLSKSEHAHKLYDFNFGEAEPCIDITSRTR